jgi:hypothetical protein
MSDHDESYDIAAIRKLMLAAFGDEELKRFCNDREFFRPICDKFGSNHGLDDIVNEVIEYCDTHVLFSELLEEVKLLNSRQYRRFAPYHRAPSAISTRLGLSPFLLFLNLLIVGIVGLVLKSTVAKWLPCCSPWTVGFGLSVVALSLVHMTWRLVSLRLPEVECPVKVNLRVVEFELDASRWLDALHPWTIPGWGIYLGLGAASAVAVVLMFLIPYSNESRPVVEHYLVRYTATGNSRILTLDEAAQEGILLGPGMSIRITISLLGNDEVHCAWDAKFGGRVDPDPGCTAQYTAPNCPIEDVIGIRIESRCRTHTEWRNLHVRVVQQ